MHTHACPGLAPRPLASYLAALGLAKVVGEQADPQVRFGWSGETFTIRTVVPDLVDFLVTSYRPTPVVSPWNSGSGFGEKDKGQVEAIQLLLDSTSERLADYRATIESVHRVLGLPGSQEWDKPRLVQELRNRLPDRALPWLDASVVLTVAAGSGRIAAVFPPLTGTGGNDGRLDFSSNFHQRLVAVLPELGAHAGPSRAWAADLISGASETKLVSAAIGQFDPGGAGGPGSSVHGAADNLVNPWLFVLMVEGLCWFASAASRRLGESRSRAAMPFTVYSSPDGPIPGAAHEAARGELWAPVFRSVTLPHLRQIMSEARASWLGSTAETVPAMYGAVHTYGVDRGIDAFERFGFLQRNGLAFVAAPLDRVRVRHAPGASLAQRPIRRAAAFERASGQATAQAARRFDAALVDFVRDPEPDAFLTVLARLTRLQIAATRAEGNRTELRRPGPLTDAEDALPFLDPVLAESAEARVAAAVASATVSQAGGSVALRTVLLGTDPGDSHPAGAVVPGLGSRPVVDVLADLLVWLSHHRAEDPRVERGWIPMRAHRYVAHWGDVHAWAAGQLDDRLVGEHLLGFLSLDWANVTPAAPKGQAITAVEPDLAVLQALASGRVIQVGVPPTSDGGRRGLEPDWPVRLRAGQVGSVCRAAADVLGRSLVRVGSGDGVQAQRYTRRLPQSASGEHTDQGRGTRMLAALAAPASTGALRRVAVRADRDIIPTSPSGQGVPA